MPRKPEGQLELFNLGNAPAPTPPKYSTGKVNLSLRHDQVILAGIGALIGLTVIFAWGVERGKVIVRGERPLLQSAEPAMAQAPEPIATAAPKAPEPIRIAQQAAQAAPAAAAPVAATVPQEGYAVQVVTYTKRENAERELQRLKEKGETGFIKAYEKHVVLYVGPFETKAAAREKMSSLKSRYSDCFVKTL